MGPLPESSDKSPLTSFHGSPKTMIQMRVRDKFVKVNDLPWKVYEQMELDVFPSSICLTHDLYRQVKMFIFDRFYSNLEGQS